MYVPIADNHWIMLNILPDDRDYSHVMEEGELKSVTAGTIKHPLSVSLPASYLLRSARPV